VLSDPTSGAPIARGFARIRFQLPTVIHAALRWHVGEKLDAETTFRYADFSGHDELELRLSSAEFRAIGLPQRIVRYRGYQDTYALEVRGIYLRSDQLRLGAGARAETAAVPREAVTPDSIDGTNLKALALAEWRPVPSLVLTAGYAATFMLPVTVDDSAFSPATAVACNAALRSLDEPACTDSFAGRGAPSAAGRYTRLAHTVSLSAALDFSWFW
jgi:long-subunit fatty acid transport protein